MFNAIWAKVYTWLAVVGLVGTVAFAFISDAQGWGMFNTVTLFMGGSTIFYGALAIIAAVETRNRAKQRRAMFSR